MTWILVTVGTVLAIEAGHRLPLTVRVSELVRLLGKIRTVLFSSAISDRWKEKVLPIYAGQLLMQSISCLLLGILALTPMAAIGVGADLAGIPFTELLLSAAGIAFSTVVAVAYGLLRVHLARR